MNNIFFTSDLHLGHDKDFLYLPRGYNSIEEHNKGIVKNWNSIVAPEDEVYILGDIMLGDKKSGVEYLKQLQGQKYLIIGNHDTDSKLDLYLENEILILGYGLPFKFKKYKFFLSHYPTLVGNYTDKNLKQSVINLCGHSHTKDKWKDADKGYIYHCELDAHNNFPVSIEQIIADLKEKF